MWFYLEFAEFGAIAVSQMRVPVYLSLVEISAAHSLKRMSYLD